MAPQDDKQAAQPALPREADPNRDATDQPQEPTDHSAALHALDQELQLIRNLANRAVGYSTEALEKLAGGVNSALLDQLDSLNRRIDRLSARIHEIAEHVKMP